MTRNEIELSVAWRSHRYPWEVIKRPKEIMEEHSFSCDAIWCRTISGFTDGILCVAPVIICGSRTLSLCVRLKVKNTDHRQMYDMFAVAYQLVAGIPTNWTETTVTINTAWNRAPWKGECFPLSASQIYNVKLEDDWWTTNLKEFRELRKTRRAQNQDSLFPGRNSNRDISEYMSRTLRFTNLLSAGTWLTSWLRIYYIL